MGNPILAGDCDVSFDVFWVAFVSRAQYGNGRDFFKVNILEFSGFGLGVAEFFRCLQIWVVFGHFPNRPKIYR